MKLKNKKHINIPTTLFLTQGDRELASSRFRVFQFLDNMDEGHFHNQVLPLPASGIVTRIRFLSDAIFSARFSDVVFVQKILFPGMYLQKLRGVAGRLVYDWDDALYTRPPRLIIRAHKQRRRLKRLHKVLSIADTVICGNDVLAEYSEKYCNDVRVVPTSIKTIQQPLFRSYETDIVTIGWIGRAENLEYLEKLKSVFDILYDKYGASIRLMVVCDKPLKINCKLSIVNKQWDLKDEEADIKGFDIGIMPLEDTLWARGKCAFKLLQYMAFSVACIGSPVGANNKVVEHGVNGLLAATDDEWINALSRLIDDSSYRKTLAVAGRLTVERKFSLNVNKMEFVKAVLGENQI